MYKIYSKVRPNTLCHLVNRFNEITERTNVADDQEFLQLATLKLNKGHTFKPHRHVWKNTTRPCIIAQESWVVIQGSVECSFYDVDGSFLEKQIIQKGDCSMSFEGGHTYLILEDNTVVYEYKTGPYTGQSNDKVFI
jgi:cupin fold WbuC family metalloprotein